jgi:NAD(P)H dehydrogenase (quinone)
MKVFIVYCHPSEDSFTREVRDSFIAGLESVGHIHILSDLYKMDFVSDLSEEEYLREAYYRRKLPIPFDVALEHEKINSSDAIVFIYPVFWSEAPAKLVGWLNRVWTYGFAYGDNRSMKQLEKGLVICTAGNTLQHFEETGLGAAMKKVFREDRLFDRVKHKEMIILEATSRELPDRDLNRSRHLKRAFDAGLTIASSSISSPSV